MAEKPCECGCGSNKCCCSGHSKKFILVVIFLIGLFVYGGFRIAEMWNSITGNYPREITVEGDGKAYATPDIARITLGVTTKGENSETIVQDNAKKINQVIAELKKFNITEQDIQTTSYYLGPNYNYEGKIEGQYLDQSLIITVRDFAKIGEIITTTSKVGANTVGGITFDISNKTEIKSRAREEAIKNAKLTAENIEKQSGLTFGKITNYYEYENMVYDGYGYGKGGGGMVDAAAVSPDIQPGQQEINLKVNLTYRVK